MNITAKLLSKFPLLEILSENELKLSVPNVRTQTIHKGEILYVQGETSDKLYFVIDGWFKTEKIATDGRQTTLRFIGPGELINELAVFSKVDNAVSVIAMEEGKVFYLFQSYVEQLLETNPKFSRAVVESLAVRIQYLLEQIEDLSFYTVDVRLARFLLLQADGNIWNRQSWITQTEMAARLGTVLDVVNRNLQKFVRDSLIEIQRDKITIVDRNRLEEIAQG